jgi:DNA-binding GntR family transcriptional regulator
MTSSTDRGTTADRIARQLMREIMRGGYRPGERIREQEVADRLGVSRGPVREALQVVEQEGLVETEPWKGARVVLLTMSDVEDLLLVTAALTEVVAGLAVRRATDEELEIFARCVESHAVTADAAVATQEQLNSAFNLGGYLLEIARSPRVSSTIARVVRLVYWQHRVLNAADAAWRAQAVETWRELARTLLARDLPGSIRAVNAVDRHSRVQVLKIHRELGSAVYRLFG